MNYADSGVSARSKHAPPRGRSKAYRARTETKRSAVAEERPTMRFAISRREDDRGRVSHWLITTDRGPQFRMNCLLSYRQFRREVRRTSGVRLAPMTTVKWFEMVAADGWPHLFRVFRRRS